jgi:hypothetical protein
MSRGIMIIQSNNHYQERFAREKVLVDQVFIYKYTSASLHAGAELSFLERRGLPSRGHSMPMSGSFQMIDRS